MSKLFRTKECLTLAQLSKAWGPELAGDDEDPATCREILLHVLKEDIINGHLDVSGPPRHGHRLGLRLITDEWSPGFIEGRQLIDPIRNDYPWVLARVALTKEAVLDFAQRHQLSPPSWWADADEPTEISRNTKGNVVKPNIEPSASLRFGKQPRVAEYLSEHFPAGVPDPGLYSRQALKSDLLKWDPSLKPLDEATLKKAIEKHNAGVIKQKT